MNCPCYYSVTIDSLFREGLDVVRYSQAGRIVEAVLRTPKQLQQALPELPGPLGLGFNIASLPYEISKTGMFLCHSLSLSFSLFIYIIYIHMLILIFYYGR